LHRRKRNDRAENILTFTTDSTALCGVKWCPLNRHQETTIDQFVIQSAIAEGRPSLGKPWARMRKLAAIDNSANIHCLRHTFASWAVMGGLSLAQTGALLGHKSTQTTLRYADYLTEAVRGYSQKTADMIIRR
jgi:site-specific recombinase XerD